MEVFRQVVWTLFHLTPDNVNALAQTFGPWLYPIFFLVIFAETGLVVVPFLPGDSLLFIIGVVTAHRHSPVDFATIAVVLTLAAVLGDAVNYFIGAALGPAVFSREDSRLLNKKHLKEAHEFYEKYGGKTIILARFIPIVRTFAPFVAGIGKMNYLKFALYNVVGGVAWVLICLAAGRRFSENEFVKKRFELVVVAIVLISVLPAAVEFARGWAKRRAQRVTD